MTFSAATVGSRLPGAAIIVSFRRDVEMRERLEDDVVPQFVEIFGECRAARLPAVGWAKSTDVSEPRCLPQVCRSGEHAITAGHNPGTCIESLERKGSWLASSSHGCTERPPLFFPPQQTAGGKEEK